MLSRRAFTVLSSADVNVLVKYAPVDVKPYHGQARDFWVEGAPVFQRAVRWGRAFNGPVCLVSVTVGLHVCFGLQEVRRENKFSLRSASAATVVCVYVVESLLQL